MRSWIHIACLALLAFTQAALAQTYPNKTVRMIVRFGPGGSADAIARPLADKLGAALGQSVVVDNRPGGLTVVGADAAAKSAPDGYSLFLMPGTHVLTPHLVQKVVRPAAADKPAWPAAASSGWNCCGKTCPSVRSTFRFA